MAGRIEAQIERFAPGFGERILARSTHTAMDMERYNPNYVGGDINAGVQDLRQQFTRPVARLVPYSTPVRGLYICSSATPPGGSPRSTARGNPFTIFRRWPFQVVKVPGQGV